MSEQEPIKSANSRQLSGANVNSSGKGTVRKAKAQKVRSWQVATAAVVTLAAVGFFSGTRGSEYVPHSFTEGTRALIAERAPSYAELRKTPHEANVKAYDGAFAVLRAMLPSLTDPVTKTPQEYQAAIAARNSRRAYDGAPPVIPHRVTQSGQLDCLVCHEHGAVIAGKIAPMMSHERHDSCTQCHIEADNARMVTLEPFAVESGFEGAQAQGVGERAWPGAPPTIPHRTLMRTQCGSCHGVAGLHGLRTPHPDRQSCTQCHGPSADFDQRLVGFEPPPLTGHSLSASAEVQVDLTGAAPASTL